MVWEFSENSYKIWIVSRQIEIFETSNSWIIRKHSRMSGSYLNCLTVWKKFWIVWILSQCDENFQVCLENRKLNSGIISLSFLSGHILDVEFIPDYLETLWLVCMLSRLPEFVFPLFWKLSGLSRNMPNFLEFFSPSFSVWTHSGTFVIFRMVC